VWPFERRRDVLRVARDRVECWAWAAQGLVLQRQQPLTAAPFDADAVRAAATAVLQGVNNGRRRIDAVVESAWLPVLQIEPGATLLSPTAVEALLRHRIGEVYGPPGSGVEWQLRAVHRPGDRSCLGFALSSAVRSALVDATTAVGRTVAALQPAIAWGHEWHRAYTPSSGWVLWLEQDRTIAAWQQARRITAMNAAAAPVRTVADVERCVAAESVRLGVDGAAGPLLVSGWDPAPKEAVPAGWSWRSVSAPSPARTVAALRLKEAS
jgi:hypothetical protein